MTTMKLGVFAGEKPRVEPLLLQQEQALVAVNCDLSRGSLRPLRGPLHEADLPCVAATIFKHAQDGWLHWPLVMDIVKSSVLDVDGEAPLGHILLTGAEAVPMQYFAGGATCRLALPRPLAAPVVSVDTKGALHEITVVGYGVDSLTGVPARGETEGARIDPLEGVEIEPYANTSEEEESGVNRSTAYCYTFVRSLAGGVLQQEGAPSPASVVVDVLDGGGVVVSGFVVPEGYGITHVRLYRTVSGTRSTDFRFVSELSVADLSVADLAEYTDTVHDAAVSIDVLKTALWDAIPDDARGLIKTDNGLYAAFRGNELLISEPFVPYAFPAAYRLTVEDPIVALGHVDGTIVVMTRGRPYLAQGAVPESLQLIHLPIEQACVSAQSVASLPGGVVYASPDGLMLFSSAEQNLITGNVFTREQWRALRPETMMGTVHDGRYVGFFAGTGKGIVYDFERADLVRVTLPDTFVVHGMRHHSEDDCIYLSIETSSGSGVYRFEAGEPMPYVWRSKPFFTSALVGMSALRVLGEQSPSSALIVDMYGPCSRRRQRVRLRDTRTKRITPMRAERVWSVELSGTCAVAEVRLGGSVEGVEYGS